MSQFHPWKNNSFVVLTEILLFILLALQVSNSVYSCSADDMSDCAPYPTIDDAVCYSSALISAQATSSSSSITILCPWQAYQTAKAFSLIVCALGILNLYLFKLIRNSLSYIRSISIVTIVVAGLLGISGLVDLITVSDQSCSSEIFAAFPEDHTCNKFWFIINSLMEMLCGVALVFASLRMKHSTSNAKANHEGLEGAFDPQIHTTDHNGQIIRLILPD